MTDRKPGYDAPPVPKLSNEPKGVSPVSQQAIEAIQKGHPAAKLPDTKPAPPGKVELPAEEVTLLQAAAIDALLSLDGKTEGDFHYLVGADLQLASDIVYMDVIDNTTGKIAGFRLTVRELK